MRRGRDSDFLSGSEINSWRYPYTRPHLPTPAAEVAEGSVVLDPRMPAPALPLTLRIRRIEVVNNRFYPLSNHR